MDFYSHGYDSLYREGKDGFIGIKRVADEKSESGHQLVMMTILDLETVFQAKHQAARDLATKLQMIRHKNLLNFIRPMRVESTHVKDGVMIFETEAPDHRLNWK